MLEAMAGTAAHQPDIPPSRVTINEEVPIPSVFILAYPRFENRRTTVDAVVLADRGEVLLGSVPMEDLDVIIDPKRQKLIVNPDYPYIPLTYAK